MWPFHTWLPDAHTEAPTVGSVLLAGILLKMGTYGFVRIALPLLPDAARDWAPWIGILAAIAIVYAALACLAQRDIKRLIAFSSVGHMGFVMLGIATLTEIGISAAVYNMVAHGDHHRHAVLRGRARSTSATTRATSTRSAAGCCRSCRTWPAILTFTAIASLGLPGLAGFWGEVMALLSSYSPAEGLSVTLFRALMVVGGRRHHPHRRLLPVDAPAGEPGHGARAVDRQDPGRRELPRVGCRGRRSWPASCSSACSRGSCSA